MDENPMVQVVADVKRAVKKLVRADPNIISVQAELVNNVYPMIEQVLVAVDARMQMAEDAIGELAAQLEDEGGGIEPELAEEVKNIFALGGQMAALLTQLQPPDDLTRKRWVELITSYNVAVENCIEKLDEATFSPEEDEDDEDEDEDEDDEEEPLTAPGAVAKAQAPGAVATKSNAKPAAAPKGEA